MPTQIDMNLNKIIKMEKKNISLILGSRGFSDYEAGRIPILVCYTAYTTAIVDSTAKDTIWSQDRKAVTGSFRNNFSVDGAYELGSLWKNQLGGGKSA